MARSERDIIALRERWLADDGPRRVLVAGDHPHERQPLEEVECRYILSVLEASIENESPPPASRSRSQGAPATA